MRLERTPIKKQCTTCNIDKPLSDYQNAKLGKHGKQSKCRKCLAAYGREYRTRDSFKESQRAYKQSDKGKATSHKSNTSKKGLARAKKYRETDNGRAVKAQYMYRRTNQTPIWMTEDDFKWMDWIYKQSARLEKLHGIKYHVDHIIPLHGELVSGLHVPSNLQILTAEENMKKGNRYEIGNNPS